jgi:YidC/Oxa1 family membrane protein insertase
MANQRILLWAALAAILWLNYQAWQNDYAPKPAATAPGAPTTAAPGTPPPSELESAVPKAAAPAQASSTPPSTGAVPDAQPSVPAHEASGAADVRVVTDVFDLDINLKGGTFTRADLLKYPKHKKQPGLVRLFEDAPGKGIYVLQSGLTATDNGAAPTHLAPYTSPQREYRLADGSSELRVPLSWGDGQGVTVTKTYVFERGNYRVRLEYAVANASGTAYRPASYVQFLKQQPETERSMFDVESYAFVGPAIYDGTKYRKLDIEDDDDRVLDATITDGWLAALQHHFVAAAVPAARQPYQYRLQVHDRQFLLGAVGPTQTIEPGAKATLAETLFIGPKLQSQLEATGPELDRTADYGKLTIIARPLFLLLGWVHKLLGNWGLAIIIVTALIKAVFYPLSEASGRSMAKMRALAPRIKNIQERYKDDREQLGRQMMELYKREKINPLAGCLPIVIQIPVFLAFYWVLLESVEMRQAPFMLWIDDLSSRDPFFILPLLMGAAMFGQYKLNPAPPDPIQAKVFMFMPLIMTVMFAWFPSGLVLYWLTNTLLSIAQQWRINRVVEAHAKKEKTS